MSPVTPPAQAPVTPPKSAPAVPCKDEDEEKLNKELIAAVAAYQQGQVQAQHGVADQPDDHQQQEKYEYGWDGDTWWEKDLDNKDEEAWCYWEKGHRMGQVDQQSSILAACTLFVFQTFCVTQSLYRPTSNFMNHPTPEAPENMKAGGWLNKCTALCHLWKNKKTDMLDKALERLSEHHSLKSSTARLERKIREEGDRAYKRFL